MSSFHNNALVGASGLGGYQIERSLRFNNADSAYLSKGSTLSGNRRLHTLSFWVKRAGLGSRQTLFGNTNSSGNGGFYFEFDGNDALLIGDYTTGWVWQLNTTARYRDPSAWYHIVFAVDTANATASSRARLYVNGIEVTAFSTASYMSQNYDTYWNYNASAIGRLGDYNGQYFSGYLTEVHFIDGQALTPSSFGETDTITGVWKPKRYSGTYGTNGFYLKFADNSGTTSTTLGKDSSGNGNNWTPNNFSVTAGAGNDSLIDTPTPYADGGNGRGNYATLNAVDKNANITPSNGNLDIVGVGTVHRAIRATIAVSSGKWYWEATVNSYISGLFGIAKNDLSLADGNYVGSNATSWGYIGNGNKYNNGSAAAYGASFTTGDVIGVALDADNGTLVFYKNNVSQGTAYTGLTSGPYFPAVSTYSASDSYSLNFGQRSFSYTPPAGFLALNTQNLPEPSIKKPNQWMDATTYTGTSASNAIVNAGGFQPDLVWLKNRNYASGTNHVLVDAVRGVSLGLASNLTNAEFSTVGNFSSINSNGFTVTGTTRDYNFLNDTFVAWQWKESATPGFDIVTYTGNGTNRTIAHSLGVDPKLGFIKRRDSASDWSVYYNFDGLGAGVRYLTLNSTAASVYDTTYWNSSVWTSTLMQLGTNGAVNTNSATYVAYLWSEVAGFSKFGSYTGNGSSDGPFVFCGFRPRWIMFKSTTLGVNWVILDTSRDPYNQQINGLIADGSNSETASTLFATDALSNGFKLRTSWNNFNQSGQTFIFAAFAESPFKYSLAR